MNNKKHLRSCVHIDCYNDKDKGSEGIPVVMFTDHIACVTIEDCSSSITGSDADNAIYKNVTVITLDTGRRLATPLDFCTVMEMIDESDAGAIVNQMQIKKEAV